MINFTFRMPRMVFGVGVVDQLGQEAKSIGDKALLVTGRRAMREAGVLDRVMENLRGAGVEVVHFDQVEPNPRLSTVEAGAELARREGCGFTIGLGGGSAMDAAKLIALAAVTEGSVWDYIYQGPLTRFPVQALPVIAVPTTAATGSEADGFAVVTNQETHEKVPVFGYCIIPQVSLVDPQLTVTVPPRMTAGGAVDIVSHVLDPYLSGDDSAPLQDRIGEAVIITVMENLPRAMENGQDIEARSNLSWCSGLAISDLTYQGRGGIGWPLHFMEHMLSGYYEHISHGDGLAVLFPHWMEYTYETAPERFAQLAERVYGVNTEGMSTLEAARLAGERMREWLRGIGLDLRLRDLGIEETRLEEMAEHCVRLYGFGEDYVANPRRLYASDITEIFRRAF